jgi:hypothetical protein
LDVLVLVAGWVGVAVLCRLVGLPSSYHGLAGVAFAAFSLPGWFLSRFFRDCLESLPHRFWVAAVISFVVYGDLAFLCYSLGWGFDAFYALFAAVTVAVAAMAWRADRYRTVVGYDGLRLAPATALDALVAVSLLVFLASFYRTPHNNDLQVFLGNMVDHQVVRSFQPSTVGEAAFGIDVGMPRAYTHLYHVFPALLGDAIGVNVLAVSFYLATIPLGLLMFASLFYYLRSLCGRQVPTLCLVVALLLPVTVFHVTRNPHRFFEYHFHLFNSSLVDKSFALFFFLPALLFLTVSYLRSGRRRYVTLLVAGMPLTFYLHPLTGVYYFMSAPVLLVAFLRRTPGTRLVTVALYAVAVVVGALARGDQERAWLHDLLRYDATHRDKLHFWPGLYLLSGLSVGGFRWVGDTLWFWPHHYLTAFIVTSVAATLVWVLLRRLRFGAALRTADEAVALRAQLAYLLALGVTWVGGQLLANARPDLYEAAERLLWMYFGFTPYAFVAAYLLEGWRTLVTRRIRPGWAAAAMTALPSLLLAAHLARQVHLLNHPPEHLPKGAFPSSYATEYRGHPELAAEIRDLTEKAGRRRELFRRPDWLRDDDRIYQQTFRDFPRQAHEIGWRFVIEGYPIARHLIYFTEVGHEAFAYQTYGDEFLARFDAFYDGFEGKVTPRLVEWLKREGVTVIISPDRSFVDRVLAAMGRGAEPVAPDTYRLGPAGADPATGRPPPAAPSRRSASRGPAAGPARDLPGAPSDPPAAGGGPTP